MTGDEEKVKPCKVIKLDDHRKNNEQVARERAICLLLEHAKNLKW